jgi:hypothetical protein
MPTLVRRGLFVQAALLLLVLAAPVDARRRSKAASDTAADQFDELPPQSPPAWKGKIGA